MRLLLIMQDVDLPSGAQGSIFYMRFDPRQKKCGRLFDRGHHERGEV